MICFISNFIKVQYPIIPTDLEYLSHLADYNFVGAFHVAIGTTNGILLLKFSNSNLIFIPPSKGGIELLFPLTDTFDFKPVAMEFSPDDNYLYVIGKNINDESALEKIFIYTINSGAVEGCITSDGKSIIDSSVSVDNTLSGNLQKITLLKDGSIYIFSDTNEYYKIPNSAYKTSVNSLS